MHDYQWEHVLYPMCAPEIWRKEEKRKKKSVKLDHLKPRDQDSKLTWRLLIDKNGWVEDLPCARWAPLHFHFLQSCQCVGRWASFFSPSKIFAFIFTITESYAEGFLNIWLKVHKKTLGVINKGLQSIPPSFSVLCIEASAHASSWGAPAQHSGPSFQFTSTLLELECWVAEAVEGRRHWDPARKHDYLLKTCLVSRSWHLTQGSTAIHKTDWAAVAQAYF